MKTIVVDLNDENGIKNAIKDLRQYRNGIKSKALKLIDRMLRVGEEYAINSVAHIDTGETLSSIKGYRNGTKGVIVAGGNAIWIEFGTGVKNNGSVGGSPHPKGGELGMSIGTYGQGHGADPNGWWYFDGAEIKHTYGIKANMFMYKTALELQRVAPELAKEVFSTCLIKNKNFSMKFQPL